MGFEPTDGSLGSYCLTTWRRPHVGLGSIILGVLKFSFPPVKVFYHKTENYQ